MLVNVAGGWAGGNLRSDELFDSVEKMLSMNYRSAVTAAHVGSKALKEGGLLVLTGASPALGGTGFMIGYGMAKAAVHQLVASIKGTKHFPKDARVCGTRTPPFE